MHRLDLFPKNTLIGQYRQVFSSRSGQDVLSHILYDLGLFLETTGQEDVALRNYGLRLLKILGGGEPHKNTTQIFTEKLMKQQLPKEEKDE